MKKWLSKPQFKELCVLVLKYPELAQEYADQLPKATMDEK